MTTQQPAEYYGKVPPEKRLDSLADLAGFLGADSGSFTHHLLYLVSMAGEEQLAKLRIAFPLESVAWGVWHACDPAPTAEQLAEVLRTLGAF